MPDKRNTVRRLKTTVHLKDMTNTVKNTDIPGPTSLEAYELVHGDKEDTTSKEARLDKLYQDFRARIDNITPKPYMLPAPYCGSCHVVMERLLSDMRIAKCSNPYCSAKDIETPAFIQCE